MPSPLTLTTKVIKSKDGTDILAEAYGNSRKQAIVFTHGLACAGAHFDSLFAVPQLQRDFYLVRYDLRGQARSGKPTNPEAYESERYSDDFEAVCQAFGVTKPIFAGWSLGGTVAADILNSGGIMGTILPPVVAGMLPIFCSPDNAALALDARLKFCSAFVAPDRLASVPFADMALWVGATAHMPPACAAQLIPRKQDPTRLFEQADNLPFCIIHGKDDLIVLGDKVVENVQPRFKNCEVHLLDGVGHIPFWEEPEKTAQIISDFAKRI